MAANPEHVPKLPDLPFDIALQVFTDVSLRPSDESSSKRSDNEVLAMVGKTVCSAILTSILFSRKPPLGPEQLIAARDGWESEENLMTWISHHKDIIGQIRCIPETQQTPEILIRTWHAYMGGLHLTRGYQFVDQFIRRLVDPLGEHAAPPTSDPHMSPTGRQPPGPANKAEGHGQFLNMMAAQQHMKVEYEHESSGVPHAPTWTSNVLVDGQWKGQGIAQSKKQANEEAAKAALDRLGWNS